MPTYEVIYIETLTHRAQITAASEAEARESFDAGEEPEYLQQMPDIDDGRKILSMREVD